MATMLQGWTEYFRRSYAGEVISDVYLYAEERLMRLVRRLHQQCGLPGREELRRAGLVLMSMREHPSHRVQWVGAYRA